jgi:hypothetical protein
LSTQAATINFYQQVGNVDAAAYDYYVSSGNGIVVLDDKVAAEQGGGFKKLRDHQ